MCVEFLFVPSTSCDKQEEIIKRILACEKVVNHLISSLATVLWFQELAISFKQRKYHEDYRKKKKKILHCPSFLCDLPQKTYHDLCHGP